MKKLHSSAMVDCSVDTFWEIFFSEDYNKKLYLEELRFKSFEIVEQTETSRRVRAVPTVNMPKPVMKLIGEGFGYEEEGRLDRASNTWTWKMTPNTMKDKLFTSGTLRVEAQGDGKCKRIDEATLEAKVFGLGSIIESSTEKEVRAAWDREAQFMKRYLASRG